MLKFVSYDIVFQEVPNEVSLALNLSLCPNRCFGCHSPWLWQDKGTELNKPNIDILLERYFGGITCVCFMGGDNDAKQINLLAKHIKEKYKIKTAWYSGKENISQDIDLQNFNFIKLGPYIEKLGGLVKKNTNQKMYQITKDLQLEDITFKMQKH